MVLKKTLAHVPMLDAQLTEHVVTSLKGRIANQCKSLSFAPPASGTTRKIVIHSKERPTKTKMTIPKLHGTHAPVAVLLMVFVQQQIKRRSAQS